MEQQSRICRWGIASSRVITEAEDEHFWGFYTVYYTHKYFKILISISYEFLYALRPL